MTVDKPERRPLNVLTRAYADRGMKFGGFRELTEGWVPFTKDQTLRLVDAGFGDPQDIDGLDLRGKLALLRYGDLHNGTPQCGALVDRVDNVRKAGAAGVVWFPTNGCKVPSWPIDLTDPQTQVSLPDVWLRAAEGRYLAGLAAKGSVRIDIKADPNVRYAYELKQYEDQQIPSSLHYTYTSRDLAQLDTAFHAAKPQIGLWAWHAYRPGSNSSITTAPGFAAPQTRPVYVGPLSSDTIWWEWSWNIEDGDTAIGPWRQIDRPIRSGNRRNTVPVALGVVSLDAIHQAMPDSPATWETCRLCREGDTFWAVYYNGHAGFTAGNGAAREVYALSQTQRLYRADGEEIPQTLHSTSGIPAFTLPPQPGTYRLVDDRVLNSGARIGTTWTFTSPGTAKQTAQAGYGCVGKLQSGSTDACQPEPVVLLSYDLGGSFGLDNTVKAPGSSTMRVRAYHGQSTATMPRIVGLKLWASTDDGAHWKQLQVTQLTHGPDATFTATIVSPKLADTTGAISLKAETWDAAGNRTEKSSPAPSTSATTNQPNSPPTNAGWQRDTGVPCHPAWRYGSVSVGATTAARPHFLAALAEAEAAGLDHLAADAAHMMAIVEPGEAQIPWAKRALAIAGSSADPRARRWIGSVAHNLGWTLHDLGRYEEALAVWRRALAFREQQGDPGPLNMAQWTVARGLRSLGRYEEALAIQQELVGKVESDGYVREELGELMLALGRPDDARPYFARAYAVLSQDGRLAGSEPDRLARLAVLGGGRPPETRCGQST